MTSYSYIAIVEEAADGGFGVHFPDLPGCVSAGATLHEAVAQGAEALALHLEGMIEDKDVPPEPSTLDTVVAGLGKAPARFVYTSISAEVEDKGERVNVYLPRTLLAQIDRFGERTGIDNRSTFFRLAARRFIASEDPVDRIARGSPPKNRSERAVEG